MNFEILRDAFLYPLRNLKGLILLFFVSLGFILIIPGILAYGYWFKIVEHTLKGEKTPPRINNSKKLLINGLKIIGINIVYMIPYIAITLISIKENMSVLLLLAYNIIHPSNVISTPYLQ